MFPVRTPIALLALTLLSSTALRADSNEPNKNQSSVPTALSDGSVDPTMPETAPPSYSNMGWSVGGAAGSNSVAGSSVGVVVDLFSFRRASIGRKKPAPADGFLPISCPPKPESYDYPETEEGRAAYSKADAAFVACTNLKRSIGHSYPTHAVEVDANVLTGGTESKKFWFGGSIRARGLLAGTTLKRAEESCGAYLGGALQLDGEIYGNRAGQSRLSVYTGPEGGIMCQFGDVMLQLGGTAAIGNTTVGTTNDVSESIGTGKNLMAIGSRARLLIGDRLYFSADAVGTPELTDSSWTNRQGSLNAQLRAGGWVFMGTFKRVEMKDLSGVFVDVKSNEATVGLGHNW